MKKIFLLALVLTMPVAAFAYRKQALPDPQAVWLRISSERKKGYEYIEVAQDGAALYFSTLKAASVLKAGQVQSSLYHDLVQELENADIFDVAQEQQRGQTLFASGAAVYSITAVIKGEMLSATVPDDNLSTGFKFALGELTKAIEPLKEPKDIYRFLLASPLSKANINALETTYKKSIIFNKVETSDLEAAKILARALLKPYRLIPVAKKEDLAQLTAFLAAHKIKPDLDSYFIETSRGRYRINTVNPGH